MTRSKGAKAAQQLQDNCQGRPKQHADAHEESGPENQDRRPNRNRRSGNKRPTGATGNHSTRGSSGVPGRTVSTDREGECESSSSGGSGSSRQLRRSIQTSRFGPLEVPEDAILNLPFGIPGFDRANEFVLLDHRPGSIFRWLQCIAIPELAFVVIDPLMADSAYPIDEVKKQLGYIDIAVDENIIVLGICTVPAAPEVPTVNLMAPIGIGLTSRQGAQVILHDRKYSARHEFLNSKAA